MRHETVPLRADIRLLGGVLGEVIREAGWPGPVRPHRGDPAGVRRLSPGGRRRIAFRKPSRGAAIPTLDLDQTVPASPTASTSFSQLTNIAEDQARTARAAPSRCGRAARHGSRPTLEVLTATGRRAATRCWRWFSRCTLGRPVLTAHPTEIRRKSIIERVGADFRALLDAHRRTATRRVERRTADGRACTARS